MIMRGIKKFIPRDAPIWMRAADGNAVWCWVWNDDPMIIEEAWVMPHYNPLWLIPFKDSRSTYWSNAYPVTDKETIDETEGLR